MRSMHAVSCPDCQASMVAVRRPNVEVDACTDCHGAWFDSGELDLHLEQMLALDVPDLSHVPQPAKACPHCEAQLEPHVVPKVPGATALVCARHGLFVDGHSLMRLNTWAQALPLTVRADLGLEDNKTTSTQTSTSETASSFAVVALDSATGDLALEGVGAVAEILITIIAAVFD